MNKRDWKTAIWRGFVKKCPRCGEGHIFKSYLGTSAHCPSCQLDLSHHRADDAPPYFTIFAVGHMIVPMMLAVEKFWRPELWVHFVLWLPLTLILTLWLLPRTKGATVGLQWAFKMHGFEDAHSPEKPAGA
jgi:uncharacterized protein (DUF983 family)